MTAPALLSTRRAAELCGVDRRSMLRWVKAGLLRSQRTGGGQHRIPPQDLLRFMRERDIPVPGGLAPAGPPRVVIVDDDLSWLRALERVVRQRRPDAVVRCASDGFSGGLLVAGSRPDLLFLDLRMPGVDGFEVCRQIRAVPDLQGVAVVVVSGHVDDASRRQLAAMGADRCLEKPASCELVERALADFLPAPVDAALSARA